MDIYVSYQDHADYMNTLDIQVHILRKWMNTT